ncbi:hypothetical protein ACH5RR_007617 [Cinchona calisaya]|uniref:LOB domain-containing protein n=1 Tax=Cinchona calisaya TaxID=153742 RepID=A0ABD3ACM0_9GENT
MTLKGGTSQACAVCKYQRRRCTADCPLAPYFPADQPKMFQNAHRLFGVSNILKILKQLDPSQKLIAMKSIIYQANIRDKDPVYGCLGLIQRLYYQIQLAEEEIQYVYSQLAFYRQHQQQQEISTALNDSLSQLQLGMAPPNSALTLIHQDAPQQHNDMSAFPIGLHPSYPNSGKAAYNTDYMDSKENNTADPLWIQQTYNNYSNNSNPMIMQSQLINSDPITVQQEATQEYDEMHSFFDTIDDRQSYIDSKDAYESSSESSLKDTTQSVEHVAENELKSAAACFSLTSVNQ